MAITKATWFAVGVMFVGACKGELSLGSLTGKKPSSSSSSSSSSNDSSSSSGGGGGAVTPPPEVGQMETGKAPPWCKGYERSSSDSNLSWVKSYMEREGWSGKTMEYVAKASCDKTDGERQAKVAEWAGAFKAEFHATDKDFVEMMTFQIMPQEQKSKLEDEQCAGFKEKDPEASLEQVTQTKAQAWLLGCDNRVEEETLYYFDRPQIAEWMRAAILSMCIQGDPNKDKESRGEFAFCLPDMKALDRGKFEKELAGMKVNFYGKTSAMLNFNIQKANSQILLKRYAEKGKKDEEWQRLFDAPEKGWTEWMTTYEANKAAFEAVREFDKKAAKGSKKALADCGGTLRKLWFDYVKKSKKVKDIETAQTTGTNMVGYPLLVAMMRCDAATDRYLEVAAAQDLFMQKAKESRGPRYAAYDATMTVLNDIRNDREKFPLERMYPSPPSMGRNTWYKAYEQTFNKISYDRGTGQIKDIKKKGDVVKVTFKTVKWKEEEAYDCRDTRKVYRIRDDGTLEYYQKCKYKTVQRSSTLEPVDVPADFADGLKEGLMVDLMINTKVGRVAIPKGVYKDVDKKKFVGTFGIVW
jgi:hypothetical protein